MAAFLVAQLIYGPLGTTPAPTWILAALAMIFARLTVNFRHVTLTLTQNKVEVRYGIFRASCHWEIPQTDILPNPSQRTRIFSWTASGRGIVAAGSDYWEFAILPL